MYMPAKPAPTITASYAAPTSGRRSCCLWAPADIAGNISQKSLGGQSHRSTALAVWLRNLGDFVGPYLEADQGVRPEGLGDRHIGGIAALRYQDAADPRHVVARIEHVPASADIGLEPAGEVTHRPRQRGADVAEVPGAVARRNIHAAAEGDGEMGIVAAHAFSFIVDFPGRHGGAGVFIAERDVTMDEIANRLHPRPARRGFLEQLPCDV